MIKKRVSGVTILFAALALYGCGKTGSHSNAPAQASRTAAWYESHPDVMKADEQKCAGDAASISRDQCQNVYAAENALGAKEMEDAAARNNAASSSSSKKK